MKKLLPLLLATSLLLSACSIDWDDKKVVPVENVSKPVELEDIFKKKQECLKYKDEIQKIYRDVTQHFWTEDTKIEEIFYSPNWNSCYWIISSYSLWVDEEFDTLTKKVQQLELLDILNHTKIARKMNCDELNNCTKQWEDEDKNYLEQIKFLKWE